jgi:predicted glutamine amidotransferase
MCELLGLAFNEPVTARISFRGFRHGGAANPDGWGLAWFENGQLKIEKEPKAANSSEKALEFQSDHRISSPVFIGHVRHASKGSRNMANTHPFRQTFSGTPVVFAHNGTLCNLPTPNRFNPAGETDSERAFCLLLSWMDDNQVRFSDFEAIEKWLRKLNEHGDMNLLFSNGLEFFAYRDINGYKGLCLTHRQATFATINLADEDWEVDLSQEKKPSERGFVVATRPLTEESWTNLNKGRLLVIRAGAAAYGDPRT